MPADKKKIASSKKEEINKQDNAMAWLEGLASKATPVQPSSNLPDWLRNLDSTPTRLEANLPDWIKAMAPDPVQSPSNAPDWLVNLDTAPTQSQEDIPDWLRTAGWEPQPDVPNWLTGLEDWVSQRIRIAKENQSITLDLSGSGNKDSQPLLSEIPSNVFELINLQELNLSNNLIDKIPNEIGSLVNLKHLNLYSNNFSEFPLSILQLKKLEDLNFGGNILQEIPEKIENLTLLRKLSFRNNKLSSFPSTIAKLQQLRILDLSENEFNEIPDVIYELFLLEDVDFSQSSDIPDWLSSIGTNADISTKRKIRAISNKILLLENLKTFLLTNQPIETPPIEIVVKGVSAIRDYFRQLESEGEDHLFEAKLIILGEGGAGKTSLSKKIRSPGIALNENEKSTDGIDVLRWRFYMENGRSFQVNIWDFGGQEIYHATHQFFLTKRSLYLLVADTRKEDTDFFYWLNVVDLLSENSPLLIIKNEKQDRHREIDDQRLKSEFGNIQETLATNLETNRGLPSVINAIKYQIVKLPHVGSPLPRTWVKVRQTLEKDPRNYISTDEYLTICEKNGITEISDKLQLSGYLHDLGVCLHFQDEPLLRKTVILKPQWGTDAVYKVLDNKSVIEKHGEFTKEDLSHIWSAKEYENMLDELLQLMMKFKLCYRLPDSKETYLAPQLLLEGQPQYIWPDKRNFILRYTYDFMPKGIITQFIVRMHKFIPSKSYIWKNGVILAGYKTGAEVVEDYQKREIRIRIVGKRKRELMTIITYELDKIHSTYRRLRYHKWIPCNCSACKETQDPYFYPFEELQNFVVDGQSKIQCRKKPYEMVNVLELLGDVIDLRSLMEERNTSVFAQKIENFYYGVSKMTENKISINNSTVQGNIVVAETIRNSLNQVANAAVSNELKDALSRLVQAVDAISQKVPKDDAENIAGDLATLVTEATKKEPRPKWYQLSANGLAKAAENVGKIGEPVIKLVGEVLALLMVKKTI